MGRCQVIAIYPAPSSCHFQDIWTKGREKGNGGAVRYHEWFLLCYKNQTSAATIEKYFKFSPLYNEKRAIVMHDHVLACIEGKLGLECENWEKGMHVHAEPLWVFMFYLTLTVDCWTFFVYLWSGILGELCSHGCRSLLFLTVPWAQSFLRALICLHDAYTVLFRLSQGIFLTESFDLTLDIFFFYSRRNWQLKRL